MDASWPGSKWSRRTVLGAGGLVGAGAVMGGMPLSAAAAEPGPASVEYPHDPATAPVKAASTFFTTAQVEAARRNVGDYAWGAALRDAAVERAQPYVDADPAWLWDQVSGQGIPRSYAVNQDLGSPITGRDIYEYGNYPWIHDHFERPWKLVDPSSDYVFPTNDFEAFHRSGLDANGEFDRSLADESLLVNELYPERGPSWGVDDGFGWIDETGDKWTFVAYYNHWAMWYSGWLGDGVNSLCDAYLYTGDVTYAKAGLILIDRVADLYPSMDTEPYKREDGYFHSDGLSGNGRVVGCIWETGLIRGNAYDAFFPAIAESDTSGVLEVLGAKAQQYELPPKDTVDDIRLNIENGILRQTCGGVLTAKIFGNFGMHQHSMAAAAVVLDDPNQSPSWIDFVFASGGRVSTPEYHVTGGAFYQTLMDLVDRDGAGNEGAPGYNDLWIGHVKGVADVLDGYAGYPEADLYEHPKYAKMFQTRPRLTMVGSYFPSIGDSGQTGKAGLRGTANDYVAAFERFGLREDAQLAFLLAEGDVGSLYSDVYSLDVDGTQERIADIIKKRGPFLPESDNLTGYGLAVLRDGDTDHQRTTWMYYGRNTGHGHLDTLNLGLYAYGLDLLADLGYPEFADNNARRHEWTSNTIAHNTVVVDEGPLSDHWVGTPHGFVTTKRVQFAEVAAPQVYPQTSRYRRAVAQIRIDDTSSYTVDFFRVTGGTDHRFSFHAAEGPVSTTALDLLSQPTGSYAGPDIEPPPADAEPRPGASGLDWLANVERADAPPASFTADWSIVDTYGTQEPNGQVHLRLHAFHDAADVALADGFPPRNKTGNPESLHYLISRRTGADLASQFVSVIEPYLDQPVIASVEQVSVTAADGGDLGADAAAVKVELVNGRVDYVVSCTHPDVQVRVDDSFTFTGAFGVCSLRDDRVEYGLVHAGTELSLVPRLTQRKPELAGSLAEFTRELSSTNTLTVRLDTSDNTGVDLERTYAYVENDGVRNACYAVRAATVAGRDTVLDIGDSTPIRQYVDPNDFDLGFDYDVERGARVRLPLTHEWSVP